MIVLTYFMLGLYISVLGLLLFFGPFQKDREEGRLISSEITILVLAIVSLLSLYHTISRYLQALQYIQIPPQYWIEDSPPVLFELYFMLTFLPLVLTTILLSVVYLRHKSEWNTSRARVHRILRKLLILESMLFFIGAIFVTNLHPTWMQVSLIVLVFFIPGTATSYIMTRSKETTREIV